MSDALKRAEHYRDLARRHLRLAASTEIQATVYELEPSVRHPGLRLLRMAQEVRRQAAVFHQRRRWQRAEFRWAVGPLEKP